MSWRTNMPHAALWLLLLTAPLQADPAQDAQAAWARRAEPAETERAITLWEQALAQNPQQPEIVRALAKACGRAYRYATKRGEKKKWADRALKYGKLAI